MRARHTLSAFGLAALLVTVGYGARETSAQTPGPSASASPSINGQRPACVTATQSSVFNGVGYNHLVTVANGCANPVSCVVTTSVSPEPRAVTVAPQRSEVVNTFLGSPSAVFTPTVQCR